MGVLLPPVTGRAPGRRARSSTSPSAASTTSRSSSTRPYPFEKYDQLFVPEFNAGAMENAGAVTIPRGLRLPVEGHRRRLRAARRDDPARTRAHVVRRPRHHALVGRPLAQRVVRHLRVGDLPCPRPRTGRTRGPRSPTSRRPGPTDRTSCPRRTRSRPTSRDIEDVEVNFDGITYAKGASVLKQLVAWVGRDAFRRRRPSVLRATRVGQHRAGRPARVPWRRRPAATCRAGPRSGWRPPGSTRCGPTSTVDAEGRFTSFAIVQTAPDDHPTLRSHRLAIGLYDHTATTAWSRIDRVELDVVGERTSVSPTRRQAHSPICPAQRRRPRLHQDPARPAVG